MEKRWRGGGRGKGESKESYRWAYWRVTQDYPSTDSPKTWWCRHGDTEQIHEKNWRLFMTVNWLCIGIHLLQNHWVIDRFLYGWYFWGCLTVACQIYVKHYSNICAYMKIMHYYVICDSRNTLCCLAHCLSFLCRPVERQGAPRTRPYLQIYLNANRYLSFFHYSSPDLNFISWNSLYILQQWIYQILRQK